MVRKKSDNSFKPSPLQRLTLQRLTQSQSAKMPKGLRDILDGINTTVQSPTGSTITFTQYQSPKGVGMASSTTSNANINQFQQMYQQLQGQQAKPKKPMQPPIFQIGSKVTVRSGKTTWTVVRHEQYQSGYRESWMYFLGNERGQQTREDQGELVAVLSAMDKKTEVDFDTVVISDEKRQQILQAIEQVNQADLIFKEWGFAETIEKGRGVSMLFYGPPGTGKTLMAQAIANKLKKTLTVISTADIESSAPGEAERNIRKHFKEAKEKGNILLFDECDSLIFTRNGVGPILSAQINELLSQIEKFDGITLFTTNRLGTLDEAVNRRLALKLEFAMPSQEERAEIWKRMFPKKAPLDDDVDFMRLAIIEMTGGYIKNAVLRAARAAAMQDMPDSEKTIKMEHLVLSLKLEAESMDEFEKARQEESGKTGHVKGRFVERGQGGIKRV